MRNSLRRAIQALLWLSLAACGSEMTLDDAARADAIGGADGAAMDTVGPSDTGPAADVATTDAPGADRVVGNDVQAVDVVASDTGGVVPTDPAMRTQAQICARWNADFAASRGVPGWTAPAAMCDPGVLAPETIAAAVRMTNAYRFLAGLNDVPNNAMQNTNSQACALMMQRNRMLSHTPPTTWICYSAAGADGAARSNITSGGSSPTASVAGFVDDSRDISGTLGHRRWMLWPPLGPIGYGQTTNYACLYVIGGRGTGMKSWVAWPNEGPTPMESMSQIWSFSSRALGVGAATRAAVTRDGVAVAVTAMFRTPGYGDNTISWMMPAITVGSTYHVTISGLTGANVEYDVRPVRCGP